MKIVRLRDVTESLSGTSKRKIHILDSDEPQDVKLKLYMGQLYHDLKHFFDEKKKKHISLQTEPEQKSSLVQTEDDYVEPSDQFIIEFFKTPALQGKAEKLLEKMKKVISWNSKGQIIHKGGTIQKSDIKDLTDYIIRRESEKSKPFYFDTLKKDLDKAEIGGLYRKKAHSHELRGRTRTKNTNDRRRVP
jgi:hypothetical protein